MAESKSIKVRVTEEQYNKLMEEVNIKGYRNLQECLLAPYGIEPRKQGRQPKSDLASYLVPSVRLCPPPQSIPLDR